MICFPPATADVVEVDDAFLLRPDPPEAVDMIDRESSGVKQKNSSSGVDPESIRSCELTCVFPWRLFPCPRNCEFFAGKDLLIILKSMRFFW